MNSSKQSKYDQERELIALVNDSDLPNKESDLLYLDAYIADINNEDLDETKKKALKDKIFSRPDFDKSKLALYCNFMILKVTF